MKKLLKISIITLVISLVIISVKYYIVNAYSEEEEFIYKEEIELNNSQQTYIQNNVNVQETSEKQEFNLDSIIVKDEKYTTEYETTNGEKYTIIGTLKIDKLNIEYDILSSTSVALLKVSLNRYWGCQPNEVGNMCIVGHNYLDSRFFGKLHTLNNGDCIEITDSYGKTLKYYVYDMFVADPYDTSATSQLTNGNKEITLITCYNKGTQRLIVKARAEQDEAIENTNDIIGKILERIF